jgi:colanic acid/amylovoran biosynthesis glycosyltransferase
LTWLFQWIFYNTFRDVDVFHVQYGTNSNPLSILKKIGFKPSLIVTFHGHDAFFPINGFIPNDGYYDNLFQYANLITANTPYLGGKVLELGCPQELLTLIPVGVNGGFFYPNKHSKGDNKILKLVSVGRLDKFKGHINCIEALHLLLNRGIDASLTIIGEGEQRLSLENLIYEYQLEEKVFLLGKKSQFEIRQELWKHDIYLHMGVPSTNGLRETQGLATLEAQACGLLAIVFDSGGVKYTVDDGVSGYIFREYDIKAVVEKLEFLSKNQEMIDKIGENGVLFVKKEYDQQVIDKRWKVLYDNLSNGK